MKLMVYIAELASTANSCKNIRKKKIAVKKGSSIFFFTKRKITLCSLEMKKRESKQLKK